MADVCRAQGSAIARVISLLPALLFAGFANSAAMAQLFEQPMLVIDPGMHTSRITAVDVDATGQLAVTGSYDKTVRLWSLTDGKLLRTIRMPAGPENVGKIFAVAMSPDGALVAAGGWAHLTATTPGHSIYLLESRTGKMTGRIPTAGTVTKLTFSSDGRYLAAGLGSNGLRVFDRDRQWSEVFRDTDYGADIYGVTFAADGRLAVASYDGKVRLYDQDFKLVVPPTKTSGGQQPFRIAFSPDGAVLAVGHEDEAVVDLFDGHTLAPLPGPNVDGLSGWLSQVAWSKDGKTLYAGGAYSERGVRVVLAWADAGRGERRALPAGRNTVGDLAALPDGELLVATTDPLLELLAPDDKPRWVHPSPIADLRDQVSFGVSADGTVVEFGFEEGGKSPLRFDVRALKLVRDPPADHQTTAAKQAGLAVVGWRNGFSPTLDGKPIKLNTRERSRSLAIHPDGGRFVLGAEFTLQAIDKTGERLWQRATPSVTWAVNISGDGRLVVAAYGEGTIRWYRMDDGRELLALFVLADKQDWVAWTPDGFYDATPGAFGVLQWQVNHGFDAAADTVPMSAIPRLRRPDALALVLQELESTRALGIADLIAARKDVQIATGSTKAPGARLHVLTIGISDYGDKAKDLRLKFADRDAHDVANALLKQDGGLYAEVLVNYLHDDTADRAGIFNALAAMQNNMSHGAGQDLAVIMFSGHGTMIDNQFYFVPYGVDDSTPALIKASAISATELHDEISQLAENGRVLVLLDACRSGGLLHSTSSPLRAADTLRFLIASGNVTVLTSSKADQLSREDENWQHGAFTKVLLDALSGTAMNTDHGVITISGLTDYIDKHIRQLTAGDQQLGVDQQFTGDIFVAGF